MKLILMGCEYSGTTTLAVAINNWLRKRTGSDFRLIHDHWKIPHTSGHLPNDTSHFLTEEEQASVLALSPKLKEMHQRHSIFYHTHPAPNNWNLILVGYHFDNSIYGAHYFEYGRPTDPEDAKVWGRRIEHQLLTYSPDTVLVSLTADADVIKTRMHQVPHSSAVLREEDIEYIQSQFEEEYKASIIMNKLSLDTSTASLEDTMTEFVEKIQPYLSEVDLSRIIAYQSQHGNADINH